MEDIRPEANRSVLAGERCGLGVVVPALDEADALPALLDDLAPLTLDARVLVVDGGSVDGTPEAAWTRGADVLFSRAGRAAQMNAGAAFLPARWLLFLHADTRIGGRALELIEEHVRRDAAAAAFFGLKIEHDHFHYRLIERGQRLRERALGLVYGDQGLLIRRDLFFGVGPYPDVPLLEDVVLNRWLALEGRLERLPGVVATSPRRYETEGRATRWLRNAGLIARFFAGASPARLASGYPNRRGSGERSDERGGARARLLIFAKAPRAGTVKTRLARSVGASEAAAVYRRLGRMVVDNVASSAAESTICYDPPDSLHEMRDWLGPVDPARCWPQGEGDLGARLERSIDRAFRSAARVVVVGADAPALDAAAVDRALTALDSADLALGPTPDGGYYLIGLKEPRPELFRNVPWSTPAVFAATVAKARAMGLRIAYLEVESDVDTVADLTPAVRERLAGPDIDSGCGAPTAPSAGPAEPADLERGRA